jgi:hypothetical protein
MYVVAAEATLLNLVSARWLHNNAQCSAESHVNARTAITWWCCRGVLCGVSAGFREQIAPTCYIRTPTILFAVCRVLLVTITSRELWLLRSPDEPVRFLMVRHVEGYTAQQESWHSTCRIYDPVSPVSSHAMNETADDSGPGDSGHIPWEHNFRCNTLT